MEEYRIITDPVELVTGVSNKMSRQYIEASNEIVSNTPKSMGYLKNFITSIESIASKVEDKQISDTRGDISKFSGNESIKMALEFLTRDLSTPTVQDLSNIYRALHKNRSQYISGYEKQIRLIILEYESAVDILMTGLSFTIANNIDIRSTGTGISIQKKPGKDRGIITRTIQEMARQLNSNNHQEYLISLINGKDNLPIKESVGAVAKLVADTLDTIGVIMSGVGKMGTFAVNTFKTMKATMFGILPMIRTALYLKYKRKANIVLELDEQVYFLNLNINQLKNIKTMDETEKREIILKQEAQVERWRKKAEKLRAELVETEKDASVDIANDNPTIQADSSTEFTL